MQHCEYSGPLETCFWFIFLMNQNHFIGAAKKIMDLSLLVDIDGKISFTYWFWFIFLMKHIQFTFDKQVIIVDILLYPKISGSWSFIFRGDRSGDESTHTCICLESGLEATVKQVISKKENAFLFYQVILV